MQGVRQTDVVLTQWALSPVDTADRHLPPDILLNSPPTHVSANHTTTTEEHALLEPQCVRLMKLWNSSLPINRLPTELLVIIFTLFDIDPTYSTIDRSFGSLSGRSTLMRVCRHWYDIACSSAALWRTVEIPNHFNRDKYLKHCIKTSTPYPLRIRIAFVYGMDLTSLYPHVGRIELLDFSCHEASFNLPPWARRLFTMKLPMLKTLRFSQGFAKLDLLSERLPQLQTLDILSIITWVPEDPAIYMRLRVLRLPDNSQGLRMSRILDLIATCQHLEVGEFRNLRSYIQDASTILAPSSSQITLHNMKSLTLSSESYNSITPFLARFRLPPSAHFIVTCEAQQYYPVTRYNLVNHYIQAVPSDIASSLSSTSLVDRAELECAWFDHDGRYDFFLVGHRPDGIAVAKFGFAFCSEQDAQRCEDPFSPQITFLQTALRGAPLTHLTISAVLAELRYATVECSEWPSLLSTFPALESLNIHGCALAMAVTLWDALTPEPGAPVPCPRLRSIFLLESWMDGYITYHLSPEFLDDMVDALDARLARGVRLEKLHLQIDSNYDDEEEDRQRHTWHRDMYMSTLETLADEVAYTLKIVELVVPPTRDSPWAWY